MQTILLWKFYRKTLKDYGIDEAILNFILTNFLKQSAYWEANSHTDSQEISRL
jgi:hypothetical protein